MRGYKERKTREAPKEKKKESEKPELMSFVTSSIIKRKNGRSGKY